MINHYLIPLSNFMEFRVFGKRLIIHTTIPLWILMITFCCLRLIVFVWLSVGIHIPLFMVTFLWHYLRSYLFWLASYFLAWKITVMNGIWEAYWPLHLLLLAYWCLSPSFYKCSSMATLLFSVRAVRQCRYGFWCWYYWLAFWSVLSFTASIWAGSIRVRICHD